VTAPDAVPDDIQPDELAAALRVHAQGWLPAVAAVELLIAHRHWLRRKSFRSRLPWWPADEEGPAAAHPDWAAIHELLITGQGLFDTESEQGVLSVAASIAAGHPCDLATVLLACDPDNVALIADAVATAGGAR
jgi:hypothetical protein